MNKMALKAFPRGQNSSVCLRVAGTTSVICWKSPFQMLSAGSFVAWMCETNAEVGSYILSRYYQWLYWWNFMKLATGRCFSPWLCGALMFTDDTDTMLPAAFQKHKIRYLNSSLTLLHSLDSIWQGRSVMLRIRHVIVDEIMNVGWIAMLRLYRHQASLKSHTLVCEASVLLSAEMKWQDLFCFIPFLRPNLNLKLD